MASATSGGDSTTGTGTEAGTEAGTGSPAAIDPADPSGDAAFAALVDALRRHAATATGPLLVTDATGVYDAFVAALPAAERQPHACASCRRFVERFGGLVTVGAHGEPRAWLWRAAGIPALYAEPVRAMARRVEDARVIGAHVCAATTWGVPENQARRTGHRWRHFAVTPPAALVHPPGPLQTAAQAAAEITEERGMVERALADYPYDAALRARTLLKGGNLYRSEKAEAIATWFVELPTELTVTTLGVGVTDAE